MTLDQQKTLRNHLDSVQSLVNDGYKALEPGWNGSHWTVFEAINDTALDAMGYVDNSDGIN